MKSNLLALLGAAVGFGTGFLIAYKLQDRRFHTFRNFWDIYDDNTFDVKGGGLFD